MVIHALEDVVPARRGSEAIFESENQMIGILSMKRGIDVHSDC